MGTRLLCLAHDSFYGPLVATKNTYNETADSECCDLEQVLMMAVYMDERSWTYESQSKGENRRQPIVVEN
jgi:hypothetical protein